MNREALGALFPNAPDPVRALRAHLETLEGKGWEDCLKWNELPEKIRLVLEGITVEEICILYPDSGCSTCGPLHICTLLHQVGRVVLGSWSKHDAEGRRYPRAPGVVVEIPGGFIGFGEWWEELILADGPLGRGFYVPDEQDRTKVNSYYEDDSEMLSFFPLP